MPAGNLWRGTPIKLQTEYVIEQKILPALALAGSSAKSVCKAQVYLVHPRGLFAVPPGLESGISATARAAISIIPVSNPGVGQFQSRLEINVLALKDAGATRKQIVGSDAVRRATQAFPAR